METNGAATPDRGRRRLGDAARAVQRRVAERTAIVAPPEVDHDQRNQAFGSARRIGVLHIPKSAGSSVSASLVAAMDDRSWSPYLFDPVLFGPLRDEPVPADIVDDVLPDPERLREVDAASGHYALSTLSVGFDPADIVLLLREPRSRLLSLYEYWRGLPPTLSDRSRTWSVTEVARDLDVDDWLHDRRSAYQTDNVVLRTLLDGHRSIPVDDFMSSEQLAELTPLAVRAARSIGWVDVVERGDEMWSGLSRRIGRPLDRSSVNATARRADLPTDLAALFSDRTVEAMYRCTVADSAIWEASAIRRKVLEPRLLAERTWTARLRTTLAAQQVFGSDPD